VARARCGRQPFGTAAEARIPGMPPFAYLEGGRVVAYGADAEILVTVRPYAELFERKAIYR